MRPSQKPNRARGRGSRKPNGNVVNRVFESAGPEGKVRGTPQQIVDKYLTLARDAHTSGDRVMAENFLQHAEHYQRILLEAQGPRDEPRQSRMSDQDGADGDGRDDSDAEESEEAYGRRQPDERREDRPASRHGGAHAQGGAQGSGSGSGSGRGQESGQENAQDGGERQRDTEVSGLTTIDAGSEDGGSLLVDAEDLSASQPPRRRRNQRRDRDQPSQPTETDAQPE